MIESFLCVTSLIVGFAAFLKICYWLGTMGQPSKPQRTEVSPAVKVAAYNAIVKHRSINNWWKFPM